MNFDTFYDKMVPFKNGKVMKFTIGNKERIYLIRVTLTGFDDREEAEATVISLQWDAYMKRWEIYTGKATRVPIIKRYKTKEFIKLRYTLPSNRDYFDTKKDEYDAMYIGMKLVKMM
jgi:hypothetical protein